MKERGTSLTVTIFGSWSKVSGLVVNLTESKMNRRTNMQGVELRASFFRVIFFTLIHGTPNSVLF